MALMLLLTPLTSSRSVHQINEIDIFPQGTFDESSEWLIETQSGFSNLDAQYTDAMIADGKLSLTHQRSQNVKELLFWSTESTSGHESAEGIPDGLVSISSGPDIDLTGFNFDSVNQYPLISVSLVTSFRISNGLNDDRVEISIASNSGNFMVHSYSSTFSQGEINYLSSPYITYDLDEFNDWSWNSISTASVKLNYESIGGSDEAQLEVDAVAIKVIYQLPESGFDFIRAETTLGLDINYEYDDLSLNLSGEIIGDLGEISPEFSWIKLQIGSELIHEEKINNLTESIEININVEKELFSNLNEALFAIGIQIYWNSNGSSSDAVLQIRDVGIDGVTFTEWDEDPICSDLEDFIGNNSFVEDSGQYKIIPLRDSCTDDRTAKEQLDFSVSTNPAGIIEAIIENGHLKIFQIQDSYGVAEVNVNVFDTSGNQWNDSFLVNVLEVNDPPEIINFPDEITIELGEKVNLNGEILDMESEDESLNFSVEGDLATINSDNSISLYGLELGTFEIVLNVSDGNSIVVHQIIVTVVEAKPDLYVTKIKIMDGDKIIGDLSNAGIEKSSLDTKVFISTEIFNYGVTDVTFVSVRYYLDEELIGNLTLPLIYANSTYVAELEWELKNPSGEYSIRVEVDSHNLIQESIESNNELIFTFSIIEDDDTSSSVSSEGLLSGTIPSVVILFGFIFISLALFFGPKKIKRIK